MVPELGSTAIEVASKSVGSVRVEIGVVTPSADKLKPSMVLTAVYPELEFPVYVTWMA